MKKFLAILICLMVLVIPTSVFAVTPTYDSTLRLENKYWETGWGKNDSDAIYADINFNSSSPTFDFSLTATGLADGNYSLIYYADFNGDRFGTWGGNNPGVVIWQGSSTGGVLSSGVQTKELNMNLPSFPDANMSEHSYCTPPDSYTKCHGAKLWLIPSGALTGNISLPVISWPPNDNWLFETDLILYNDTDVTGDSEVALTTIVPDDLICVSVMPHSLDFGSIYRGQCKEIMTALIITNCGNVPIIVTALASGSLYVGNLEISNGTGWTPVATWTMTLASGANPIHTRLCIPSDFPIGTATGALSFIAQVAP